MGAPPFSVVIWMVLALLPLAAIFSALSLALATLARSTKEGQYYLMPLMFVTLPLSTIAVMPTTEISLGNSIIPVTGVMLILRAVIEGDYLIALRFLAPVAAVTAICCIMAIRWAVDLFSNESVLFRESERFSLGAWLRHLVRDRGVTPSAAEGFMCAIVLLMLQFFARLFAPMPDGWLGFAIQTLVVQVALVATPVLLFAVMLTASPRRSLLLEPTPWQNLTIAGMLALVAHPASAALSEFLQKVYPISPDALAVLGEISKMLQDAPLWQVVLLMAVVPAICEELAFRGFVLSGLRHLGHKGMAIVISALFFGVVHAFLQQSINAFIMGMLLAYIAVQTGSLFPGIVFHAVHNGLAIALSGAVTADSVERFPLLKLLF
ncbi:MAG: CPBP family intramembrane metalloprotease, partial [Planctomycetales bacterium]|nr:CPBP family intramembrane metalloprotease [Planctomycetales bacterium]